ncbi:MAG: hypothetical protein JW880_05395, partial [Candidatus Thermoplasmatota archaeon]|nr:hypothetical protein [Candidatus Thermoplasmatota archaeon]
MRHRSGPAKKLAPTLAPGTCCPHEFTGTEGFQLEVDCESCGGAQDLHNRRCMVGIISIVARGAVPDTIMLKRFMHKRYREEEVKVIAAAAAELSALTRAYACASIPSDRRCRTCSCSPKRLVGEMRTMLLEDPAEYVRDTGRVESMLSDAVARSGCERSQQCYRQAASGSIL